MALKNLVINLADILKKVEPNPLTRRALLPLIKSDAVKREFGNRVIDMILLRTNSGFDKKDDKFTPYSKTYRSSPTFKIYKGGQRRVNLKLTGAMQASIDVVKITANKIEIGFIDDEEESKAEGHVMGTGANNALPVRDFWGLPSEESLLKTMKGTIKEYRGQTLLPSLETISNVFGQGAEVVVGEQTIPDLTVLEGI